MVAVEAHLAYAPRGAGLACALMYLAAEPDIYGWWIGRQGSDFHTAYFRLADFYTTGTIMYTSQGSDLYGGWSLELTAGKAKALDSPLPVADEISHALEQAQDAFCGEWLVLPADKDAEQEHRSYAEAELAWSEVNFQFRQLNKFTKDKAVWLYYSNGFQAAVGQYIMQRWPVDYRG
ncbi:MAG: hypothetical protein GTO41_10450 [Burkholderiales bacterium]|nr:hypothetical protein [Burkholderiales bacterium]